MPFGTNPRCGKKQDEKCSVFWFLRQGFLEPNYLLCFSFRQIKIRETNRPFQPLKVRHKVPNDFMF